MEQNNKPVKQEPVGYAAQSVIDWLVSDERTDAAYSGINLYKNPTGNSTIPLYAAPQPVKHEPVAWGRIFDGDIIDCICPEEHALNEGDYTVPLYAAPVRTKDLTDDEIDAINFIGKTRLQYARAVIAADREKNK